MENANQAAFFHGLGVLTVEWRSGGAVPRKRRKVIGFSSIVHINVLADYDIYK